VSLAERRGATVGVPPVAKAGRRAASVLLFCQGAGTASWVTRIPSIKDALHFSTGTLGLALVGLPLGLIVASQLVPPLVRRWSSSIVARWSTIGSALLIVLPALAWDFVSLTLGLVVLGTVNGISEVSVNVQAVAVEEAYARSVMSGLHALWSVGLLVGSLTGSIAAGAGVPPPPQLIVVAVALAATVACGAAGLLDVTGERDGSRVGPARVRVQRPRFLRQRVLVYTAIIAFCSLLAEGSVSDWSGVYLHTSKHASLGVAALGVSVYSIGVTVGRLAGDRLIGRLGRPAALGRTTLVAALGMAVALAAPSPPLALFGYGLLGLGVAMIVPIGFSLAGATAGASGAWALARVTLFGYAGLFLGPPVIGLVAHITGLSGALTIPAILLLVLAPMAWGLRAQLQPESR
jgi:MFS family permease